MIKENAQTPEQNQDEQPNYTARRIGVGLALAGIVGGGIGVAEGIDHHLNDEKTIVDSEHFSVNPGDTLIQDASEAAQRLALHEKVDPAKLPNVVYPAQAAQTEVGGSVQPGQGFTLEKTASNEFIIVPDQESK